MISVVEEKVYDGEILEVDGQLPTFFKEGFDYHYETTSAEVGEYVYTDGEEGVIGEYVPFDEGTNPDNYSITQEVTLKISQAAPQPTPDEPEYVNGQTGDNTPIVGFAVMALVMIGAFLFLRRPKKVSGAHIAK